LELSSLANEKECEVEEERERWMRVKVKVKDEDETWGQGEKVRDLEEAQTERTHSTNIITTRYVQLIIISDSVLLILQLQLVPP
jgi:hypothetical protein